MYHGLLGLSNPRMGHPELVSPLGFVGGVLLLLGVLEVFEEVGVEDRGGDFVVARGPLAEVDAAATVGAEGEVFVGGGYGLLAGGALEDGLGHGSVLFGVDLYP